MKAENTDNLQSIQMLRGIAAFLVVLNHTLTIDFLNKDNIFRQIGGYGWMGVEIFFIISGFIIPFSMYKNDYKVSDFKVFFFKRISRIEPPYIISILLLLALNWTNTITPWYHGPAFTIDWPNVLGHLGYLNAFTNQPWLNLVYWTLAIEFEYYFIVALLFPLMVHKNKAVLLATFFGLLACTFIPIPHREKHILLFLPFFLLGIALFLYKCGKVSVTELFVMVIPCMAACFFVHKPFLCVVSALAMLAIYYIRSVPRPLLFLGTISYSLYLVHCVLITRFMALSARYMPGMGLAVRLTLCILFCLAFAYAYFLIIEMPFHRLSRKIHYRHKKPAADASSTIPA